MNKIIGFELKKLVSKPGIYLLAVLLALLLTVSAFIYNPKEPESKIITLEGGSVTEINSDFNNHYKNELDSNFENILTVSNEMLTLSGEDIKREIEVLYSKFSQNCNTFSSIQKYDTTIDSVNNKNLEAIHNSSGTGSLDKLYTTILSYIGTKDSPYLKIAIKNTNYSSLDSTVSLLKSSIRTTINSKDYDKLSQEINSTAIEIKDLIDTIKYPDYTKYAKNYVATGENYITSLERQTNLSNKMEALVSEAVNQDSNLATANIKRFNELFNEYKNNSEIYAKMFYSGANLIVMKEFDLNDLKQVKFLANSNYYSEKEANTKYTYCFNHNASLEDYASPISFDYTSNNKVNGYDYTYFILSLFSIILIAFAVMLASYSIAGETKDGTMRFVAIRPIKRSSVIMGKFLSIALISLIMLVFGAIISFVVGWSIFGLSSNPILTIINSEKVLVLKPLVSLLIYMGAIYLQLLVYISIAMLFSSLFKSDLMAFVVTILFYIVNMMLPIFFGASSWLRFYPFTSLNLYAFTGAGTIISDTVLGKIFTPVAYLGGSILLSSIFILAIILITNILAVRFFKRREL